MVNKSIVFLRSNPVDPDSRVEKEVNSLVKAGFDIKIVAWDRNAKYKIKESYLNLGAGKVKIYRFGIPATYGGGLKNNLKPLIEFQINLFQWLCKNRNKYDVIHACDFDTAYIASYCARLFKKKLVYDIFDYYVDAFGVPERLKKFIELRDHKIINSADAVIICMEKRREQIRGTNPKRLVVLHNTPPRVNNRLQKLNLNNTKIKFVYVGILADGRLIKEIADIIKSNPNFEFHIGGFGKYETYFEEMSIKHNNVIFYGKLPYVKTLELESNCDIMTAIYDPAIPNHYYAAPNKFYEALMLGKPVIMAKNTGMDHIVYQNDFGEVIDYTVDSLKLAIDTLVTKKGQWADMSIRMRDLYEKQFSWSEMETRLIELYNFIGDK